MIAVLFWKSTVYLARLDAMTYAHVGRDSNSSGVTMLARFFDNRGVTQRQDILDSFVIALVLTGLSYAVGLSLRWETSLNWLEVFAVFTSYVSTYLCVKERRFNYPAGAVSTAAYTLAILRTQ